MRGSARFSTSRGCRSTISKIDGGFVRALPDSPNDQLVVQALVGLARGMGKRTIAEYVTDRATLELLRRYGVDYAQGFEVGRPHPRMR